MMIPDPAAGTCHKPVGFFKVHKKRLDILSTEPKRDIDNRNYLDRGLQLVLDGLVNTEEMITHVVKLGHIAEAFKLRNEHKGDNIHVMIDYEASLSSNEIDPRRVRYI